ncbi:N-acetylglucosamine kinase [Actinophytocola gossypii]|uniref:N-acetylglucosamine kinase n=1 Tax=Actinophytocola gossypii TaxID=2812003 RepID=A0ABT2J432_9PSEU|nr:BadF/BadG/BcrA/BcrD ATPase family protein [Actinophytocola gossypii]MCT2582627.1 N-acetylglucosamine kinase [Actinophytocola gossypii]
MTEHSVDVGVDVGGTSTRALAVRPDGTVHGRGTAGGGNPNSHPTDLAAKRVAEAVRDALAGAPRVRACVLGMAGESKFTDPAVVAAFETALDQVGVTGPVTVVSDAEVAFASATSEPTGTVVIGGTGAVAARIVDHRKASWIDGWGWLLGDEGSAYWIGREAVRVTLRTLQLAEPPGPLARAVLTEALPTLSDVDTKTVNHLITAANAEPPIRLARFASTVSALAATDPAAADIVTRAAEHLAAIAQTARQPDEDTPIVLAGSVIGPESPVGAALRARLASLTEAPVLFAPDGALGAAWLAALSVTGPTAPRPHT